MLVLMVSKEFDSLIAYFRPDLIRKLGMSKYLSIHKITSSNIMKLKYLHTLDVFRATKSNST